MAIWQYNLDVIPKDSIIKKHGEIPDLLFIDHDSWESYWKKNHESKTIMQPSFEDAKTINWWDDFKLDSEKIATLIDSLVTRSIYNRENSGMTAWKGDTDNRQDNDVHLSYDPVSKTISEFRFRVDVRDKKNIDTFLNGMINICKEHDLMVYNEDGKLMSPSMDLILNDLKTSNAQSFIRRITG